jgi:hypothetical protein
MSNLIDPGSCGVKRYIKEEEYKVLCDIGYSVTGTFSSSALLSGTNTSHTYTTGACSPSMTIIGNDDGYVGNVFTYTSNTTSAVISFSTLLANDTPSASLGVSCLELVYNNATLTAGGSNFTVTAPLGAGLILLKYLPKNSVNQFGNITYVYVYFLTAGCNSPNACNMVQNGGYESLSGGNPPCGPINTSLGGNPIYLSCWDVYEQNLPILFTASCTSLGNIYNLGVNTLSTTPVVSSFNGAAGNINAVCFQGTQTFCSSMKNSLSSPLIPGQPYQLSLWMQNHSSTQPVYTINPNGYAAVFSIASLPQFAMTPTLNFPTGLNVLTQFTVPAGNSWSQFTNTFVFSSTLSPHSALVVGLSYVNSASITVGNNIYETFKCFVDEISLVALPSPSFSIPTPTMCGVASFTNLGQYSGTVSGTFSGTAVTYTNGQYDFNYPPTLGAGNYPIAFTYSISGGCQHTIYQRVTSIGACCNSTTIPQFTATTISTSSLLLGPIRFSSDFTIQPGVTLSLYSDEYIFESTARIVVAANASLSLNGSHLYSCGGDLWQGILVKDGGYVHSNSYNSKDCLIEDAVTAIDAPSQATTTLSTILSLANTTFNKNYTDINFANYPCASNSYSDAITLSNCVFTCRDFTFNATSWPSVSTSSNGLRYSANTSTALGAPYNLNSATIVNLKNPYNSVKSHVAIQLTDVGTTTGTMYPLSFNGLNLSPSGGANFNLFDAHENFISANNSNVIINNSAFQNTQTYTLLSTPTVAAISHSNNSVSNFELDLSAPSPSLGNRFYDCHYAVKAKNSFNFKIENASIRSTQSTAVNSPTYYGLSINTNQAGDYSIKTNEVTNVRDGVAISFAPAPTMAPDLPFYAGTPPVYIYATYIRTITINSNTISPNISSTFTGSTSNYVKNAINLDSPSLSYVWSSCSCNSITINDNTIYHAFNGIKLSGLNSYTLTCRNTGTPKVIANNTITLAEDNTWSDAQRGIDFTNSTSLPVTQGQKIQTIESNILTVAGGTVAQNNTNIILYYGNNNGALSPASGSLYPTPHILCNDLSNAYQGFVFDGTNKPASWRGNKMEDLQIAMTLSNTGVIGQQGDSNNPSDNEWNGSWPTGYFGTWVDISGSAITSILYTQFSGVYVPPNNGGAAPTGLQYGGAGNIIPITSGYYACSSSNYTLMNSSLPNAPDYTTDELLYIANTFAYRYLAINDSLKNAATDLSTFYSDLIGSSIDKFTQVELKINEGDFNTAGSILADIDQSSFNQVETNYFSFYTLYKKYLEGSVPLSTSDVETLSNLAGLCVGKNGSAVYQARSLLKIVIGQVYNGSDGCNSGARTSNLSSHDVKNKVNLEAWNVDLFPNPNYGNFAIISKNEKELLEITINDITGRQVYKKQIQTAKFVFVLDIPLFNGAYYVTIKNTTNESVTKKMVVAK